MTDKQRAFFHMNRIVGPILFFAVIAFVLYNYLDIDPFVAMGIAALAAIGDFLALTWLMKRAEAKDE